MRVLTIIMGVLLAIAGVFCIFAPVETYLSLGWLIGALMLLDGIGGAVTWHARHKEGLADGWALASAILSIVLGAAMLFSMTFRLSVDVFLAYVIAAWMIGLGGLRCASAYRLRQAASAGVAGIDGSSWGFILLGGIAMLLLGVLSIVNPAVTMASVGIMIGIAVLASGVSLVTLGMSR